MCKNKNCMGGYDCCGCKVRTTDNCITINKDLPNTNVTKGETLETVLGKIDAKLKVITVNKVSPAPQFLELTNINDYTINISINEQVLADYILSL